MTKQTSSAEQTFLDEPDKKLWNAADRLRLAAMNMALRGIDGQSALQHHKHQRMVGRETGG